MISPIWANHHFRRRGLRQRAGTRRSLATMEDSAVWQAFRDSESDFSSDFSSFGRCVARRRPPRKAARGAHIFFCSSFPSILGLSGRSQANPPPSCDVVKITGNNHFDGMALALSTAWDDAYQQAARDLRPAAPRACRRSPRWRASSSAARRRRRGPGLASLEG